MILKNLRKSRNALAKILNKTFSSLMDKIKERQLNIRDLQISTRLIESRLEKVAEVDKRIEEYIFEEEADLCGENGSTYQEIAQYCRDVLEDISRIVIVENEKAMDAFDIAVTKISRLEECVKAFCRKIETSDQQESIEIIQEEPICRKESIETETKLTVRAEENIDHEIRIEESVNSGAVVVSDIEPIVGHESDDCDTYVRLEYCGQSIECQEPFHEELSNSKKAIAAEFAEADTSTDRQNRVKEETGQGAEFEVSVSRTILSHDSPVSEVTGEKLKALRPIGKMRTRNFASTEETAVRNRNAGVNSNESLFLWWEIGSRDAFKAHQNILAESGREKPNGNLYLTKEKMVDRTYEFYCGTISLDIFVHVDSHWWNGPVWLKLPPDLSSVLITTNIKT